LKLAPLFIDFFLVSIVVEDKYFPDSYHHKMLNFQRAIDKGIFFSNPSEIGCALCIQRVNTFTVNSNMAITFGAVS
jgi:hypothetical protein